MSSLNFQIRSDAHFKELCQVKSEAFGTKGKGECCPSWSLGNFLALLNNVSSCFSLTAQQVSDSLGLLRYCARYYHDGSLVASCAQRSKYGYCASVPYPCKHSSIVYQILHYLVDKDFLGPQTVEYQVPSLKYSVLFLPMTKGNALMEIYLKHLEGHELTYNNTTITGMDLGIKQKLFKYYLSRDSVYPILTVLALLLTMALYLRSFFLSAMSLVGVTLSLLTAYFFYKVVFGLLFFPLINLMAVLVLLGSCSNQAFTFNDFWKSQLSHNPPAALEKRVHRVLQEMGYLILVSGLTSSITFYSGYISSITVVRCFAVYLGSASLINTLFTLVWLPCAIVLQERHAAEASNATSKPSWKPCCSKNPGGFWDTSSRKRCLFTIGQKFRGLKRGLSDTSNLIFLKVLPCGVVKFRYIWICWFAVLATGGIYISCVDPGMKLPASDSRATQLFRSSHPFERYDAEYRHQFMFERMKQGEDEPMTVTLIWGVTPANDNDRFNPRSNGSFTMDPEFNISSFEAQVWLQKLCGRIRSQTFYSPPPADQEAVEDNTCFVEDLIHWVSSRRCSENEDPFSFCCNNITFPYSPNVFEQCLKMMVEEQAEMGSPKNGGLRFDSQNRIAALVVVFKTSQLYSFNFSRTSNFYKQIMSWFNNEISSAPPGLQRGWFVSQLLLYDLQQCLSSETLVVAGFSVALTFASLLVTTWNIPLSVYVTFAVGGSVFGTVGLLVLLEWQLNSVEALLISAAAGLSVDFVANYCISYCLAPHTDRLGRVAYSLKKMGCPVATGAGASFCVGIIMLPATALLFRKLGIFLLLVKCVACGFATFFFQSLCCFFGPEKNCGKIIIPCAKERATETIQPSRSGAEAGNNNPSANGTFSCGTGTGSQGRRNCMKESGGAFLCPNQHRHRQHQSRLGREPEQYELQPLACHLSDSFENSTCTSKLSNRPSVLSDDIEFCGLSPKRYYDRISTESVSEEICSRHLKGCDTSRAIQTSSPYKGNKTRPVVVPPGDPVKEKLLCKKCHTSPGIKLWNVSLSSSSMDDITVTETTDDNNKRSLSMDGAYRCHAHKRLLSCQSQSSFEGLEDSNETCLSDIEPTVSIAPPTVTDRELRPGHLNGRRDTLRLSLRETVYDPGSPGSGRGRTSQSELPVILPNSQPDLPDVWIKRDGRDEDSS